MGSPRVKLKQRMPYGYAKKAVHLVQINNPRRVNINPQMVYNYMHGLTHDPEIEEACLFLAEQEKQRQERIEQL